MKKGIIFFLLIIISQIAFGQVTIKERVEIEPKEYAAITSAASPNKITFNLQWDKPNVGGFVYTPLSPCKGVKPVLETGGSLSFDIDTAQAGAYRFRVEGTIVENQTVNFAYRIFFNGVLAKSGSAVVNTYFNTGSGQWAGFYVDYTPPLISNYSLAVPSYYRNLCYEWEIYAQILTGNNCATGVSWNPSTELILGSEVETLVNGCRRPGIRKQDSEAQNIQAEFIYTV